MEGPDTSEVHPEGLLFLFLFFSKCVIGKWRRYGRNRQTAVQVLCIGVLNGNYWCEKTSKARLHVGMWCREMEFVLGLSDGLQITQQLSDPSGSGRVMSCSSRLGTRCRPWIRCRFWQSAHLKEKRRMSLCYCRYMFVFSDQSKQVNYSSNVHARSAGCICNG